MTSVRLCSAAYQDVREAHEWYLREAPELDSAFREELSQTFQRIQEQPAAYPVVQKSIRRANISRFPYGVFYVASGDDLLVLAVLHLARAPLHWQNRD